MRMIAAFPLLLFVLIAYNIMMFTSGAPYLADEAFRLSMTSGAVLTISVGDILVLAALAVLFVEVMKAARTGTSTIVDHILSTGVFIVALVEFLLVQAAGTSTFLLIVVITLIDVVAGYSISIKSARRDFSVGPDMY